MLQGSVYIPFVVRPLSSACVLWWRRVVVEVALNRLLCWRSVVVEVALSRRDLRSWRSYIVISGYQKSRLKSKLLTLPFKKI